MRELGKEVVVWYESLLVVLGYLYTGRVGSLPGGGICVCADTDCAHVACRPAIDFQIEALYTSSVFQISELVSLFQVSFPATIPFLILIISLFFLL